MSDNVQRFFAALLLVTSILPMTLHLAAVSAWCLWQILLGNGERAWGRFRTDTEYWVSFQYDQLDRVLFR